MSIKLISYDKISQRVILKFDKIPQPLVHGLNRFISSEIPIIGMGNVNIITNMSPINGDILKDRLFQMVLDNTKITKSPDKYTFKLNKTNDLGNIITIYGEDIDFFEGDKSIENPLVYPKTPLTILKMNEEINLTGQLIEENAQNNGCFKPISGESLVYDDPTKPEPEEPTLYDDTSYYSFDNNGYYPNYELIMKGLQEFKNKLRLIIYAVEHNDYDKVMIKKADVHFNAHDVIFEGEDYTLGNLLTYFSTGKSLYHSYEVPHPLEYRMIFRIQIKENDTMDEIKKFLVKILNNIIDEYEKISSLIPKDF